MNLRQKKKHFNYSYRYFLAYFSANDENFSIHCPKKYKKTLKNKLKINKCYDYDECCRKYWLYEEYSGNIPKFMRKLGERGCL